jgi:UDP-N-acetyl-D-glucosamine dehydrogenase
MSLIDLTRSTPTVCPGSLATKPAVLGCGVKELERRILTRDAVVAVVGLGYVGIPLAVAYAEAGFRVVGIDTDARRVKAIGNGHSPVEDMSDLRLAALAGTLSALYEPRPDGSDSPGMLVATSDYDHLRAVDAVIICVPTPLSEAKEPDISYITAVTAEIARHLRPGVLVVLESTTYPGTTEEVMLPMLEGQGDGLTAGHDFFLAFSPERIDPGRTDYDVRNTPKVVGGLTPTCLQVASMLYGTVVDKVVPVSQPKVAELVKLLENTFRNVNIGLVNELAMWCDRLGVDVWEVIDAAATKPFGFMPFKPGPGLGGHCIPVDPHYLEWKLRMLDHPARFIQLAAEVNGSMPRHVEGKIAHALNENEKSVRRARVLILGVAYKPNISDVRESPALELIHLLLAKGADVSFSDPHVAEIRVGETRLVATPLTDDTLGQSDCVVIITDHNGFDWNQVVSHSRTIVDTRNATARATVSGRARVYKL